MTFPYRKRWRRILHRRNHGLSHRPWGRELSERSVGRRNRFVEVVRNDHREYTTETCRYDEGDAFSPTQNRSPGNKGACRESRALFRDACRTQGLAARFVSGTFTKPRSNRRIRLARLGGSLFAWRRMARLRPDVGYRGRRMANPLPRGPEPEWAAPTRRLCTSASGAPHKSTTKVPGSLGSEPLALVRCHRPSRVSGIVFTLPLLLIEPIDVMIGTGGF